jgi:cytochrome c oxidase subunit 3
MSFLSFFWVFYHSSLAPMVEIGAIWPPKRIDVLNPWGIQFLNTLFLLSSGAIITWVHHVMLVGSKKQVVYTLITTKQLSNYQRNFVLTFCNHTIIDVRNETNATYHLNELEQFNMLQKERTRLINFRKII